MIFEKLSDIQAEVSVPKNLENKFGGFKYRSAEMILETVKPICRKHKAVLILTDSVKQIGDRYYVEACAELRDTESEESISVYAYAREEEAKKGMDASQVTGSTSSYARKYALNGLFNLDDNKDPDSNEFVQMKRDADKRTGEAKIKAQTEPCISKEEYDNLMKLISSVKAEATVDERMKSLCDYFGVATLIDLKPSQYAQCVKMLTGGTK